MIGYPEVIILDEPMVGLDPKQIIEMRDLIKGLAKEHTVILSSHILSEISAVCDHIMIISKGKLVASGYPEDLQKMMQVKVELEVTVLSDTAQAEEVLKQMEQIDSYSFEEAEEENSIKIRITTKDNIDIRKELSVALSGAGLPILSMNRLEKSLEDIFLELTDVQGEDASESEETEETELDDEKEDADNDSNL